MRERIYIVVLTMLVGAQAAVGYLVAPTLFDVISDRSYAGSIAGAIFERMGWLSLVGLLMLLGLRWKLDKTLIARAKWDSAIILAMLGLTALGHFLIRPWIVHVRATIQQSGGFETCDPAMRAQFGLLHGTSSLIFLLVFILGLSLIFRLRLKP
jgi:hypothetical protein